MRPDRRWLFLFMVILFGLLLYAISPILDLFLIVLRQGVSLILAMPQLAWWLIGGAILAIWGLHLLVQLGKNAFPGPPEPLSAPRSHGPLSELRGSLYEARSETYSQDKVRQLLSSLAIDLISLRFDIAEEEARRLYFRADWTEDEIVKTYLSKKRDTTAKSRRPLPKWFKKSEPSLFLKETGHILNRLDHYGHSINPVRNSSGAPNAAGIVLEYNPVAEQRGILSNGVNGGELGHANGNHQSGI